MASGDATPLLGGDHQPEVAATADGDWWTKLGKYMPTGAFMVFQAVAPVITDNGQCGAEWHKIVTAVVLVSLAAVCMFMAFTDSIVSGNTLYYGVATRAGMYIFPWQNPPAQLLGGLGNYHLRAGDFVHAIVSAAVFLGLSIITPPVSTCFSVTVSFMNPTLFTGLATLVGALGSSGAFLKGISGPPRHGIGFASFMPVQGPA